VATDMRKDEPTFTRDNVRKLISLFRIAEGMAEKEVTTNTTLNTLITLLHSGELKKLAIYPDEIKNSSARMSETARFTVKIEFNVFLSSICFCMIAWANPKSVSKFVYPISIIAMPIIPKSFGISIRATTIDITKDTICPGIFSKVFQYNCDLVVTFCLFILSISARGWYHTLVRPGTVNAKPDP
jgi:hypothetical protein